MAKTYRIKHESSDYCLNCGKERKYFEYIDKESCLIGEGFFKPEKRWHWIDGCFVSLISYEGGFIDGKPWFDELNFCSEKCEKQFIITYLVKPIKNRIKELKKQKGEKYI